MERRHEWIAIGAAAMAAALAACAVAPERDDAGVQPLTGGVPNVVCPVYGCGANSPTIDSVGFHELNVFDPGGGSPELTASNTQGFALRAVDHRAQIIDAGGVAYNLHIVAGQLVGSHCAIWPCGPGDTLALRDSALVGAQIPVVRDTKNYQLVITGARKTGYFLEPGTTDPLIEAYTLQWVAQDDGVMTNLCDGSPGNPAGESKHLMGLRNYEAVVFEGDRFDSSTLTVKPGAEDNWINIGCATATLAKLLLTHNTVHTWGNPPSWAERQATLKMFSADYCGTGESFTVARQALAWQGGAMTGYYHDEAILSFEARWGPNGATCLSDPRMNHPSTPRGVREQQQILGALASSCSLPSCRDVDPPDQFDGALRISANPVRAGGK